MTSEARNGDNLHCLVGRHRAAREALENALNVAYPKGSRIVFVRSYRQTNPSSGTVIGGRVDNYPYVLVRGDSGKRKVAWISLDNIITSPNSPSMVTHSKEDKQ